MAAPGVLETRHGREREGFAEGLFVPEGGGGFAAFIEKRKPRFHA
jgi:hypothetical protein